MKSSILDRHAVSHRFARARGAVSIHAISRPPSDSVPVVIVARIRFLVLERTSGAALTPSGARSRPTQSA
jgi:hypothetical protein